MKAWDDCVHLEPLVFEVAGKKYPAPPVSAQLGIKLIRSDLPDDYPVFRRLLGCTEECAADEAEKPCGSSFDRMLADGVTEAAVGRAGFATLVDWRAGRDAAVRVWEYGLEMNDIVERAMEPAIDAAVDSAPEPAPPPAKPKPGAKPQAKAKRAARKAAPR